MTNPTVAELAAGLSEAQKRAVLRADRRGLTERQSARGTLSNFGASILDWSFRPAVFTPLGLEIRAHLKSQENPHVD